MKGQLSQKEVELDDLEIARSSLKDSRELLRYVTRMLAVKLETRERELHVCILRMRIIQRRPVGMAEGS